MAAEKKKVYGNMRIMAIEGKDIFRADTLTALKNGKLNADRFGGIIDESLDTDKLYEVYMNPIFIVEKYREYANTQIRRLTSDEIQKYMSER